jgi:hypothetical protein
MPIQGGKPLYKAACAQTRGLEDGGAHVKAAATEEPAAG